MSSDISVSRRLALWRIGTAALAAGAFPLVIGSSSAWADKGGSSGNSGGGGSSGEGGGNSSHDSSSNSGPGSANSGRNGSGNDDDDAHDVAEVETEHVSGDDNSTATPLVNKRKRRGRAN